MYVFSAIVRLDIKIVIDKCIEIYITKLIRSVVKDKENIRKWKM